MDSLIAGEGGYKTEASLGSPWPSSSSVLGTLQLGRLYNPATGDHALTIGAYMLDGYVYEGSFAAFGFARFKTNDAILNTYAAGGISVGSDYIAGGAVANWTWNGTQFINTLDYGRYMQAALFFYDTANKLYNPTEAGDQIIPGPASNPAPPHTRHGSPVLANEVDNGVIVTRATPLEFGSTPGSTLNSALLVTEDHPWIYPTMEIGKNLTLNFHGLGPVAQYTSVVDTPISIFATMETPTAYFNIQFGSFFTFDAGSNSLKKVVIPDACSSGNPHLAYTPASGFGGVIVSDVTGQNAMGIYNTTARDTSSLKSLGFSLWDFRTCGSTTKWSAAYNGIFPSGETRFTTYVVNGTVNDVAARMENLYRTGIY